MNTKYIISSIAIALGTVCTSHATVTVTSANAQNFFDSDGGTLGAGVLALLVVDTGNNGFGQLTAGSFDIQTPQDGENFFGDGDDLIVNLLDSEVLFGSPTIQGAQNAAPISFDFAGSDFAVFWFPELTEDDDTISAGDSYGITRADNWVLPTVDGGDTSGTTVTDSGNATFTVAPAPIPEPSSTALLGLGGLALLARRRRA